MFFIRTLTPIATLGIGILFTLFIGACFSFSFIFSGLWLNPLVPIAGNAAGVLLSYAWALIAKSRFNRRFRLAYSPYISRSCLKNVIQAGKPLPTQVLTAKAAVVAIKGPGEEGFGEQGTTASQAREVLDFQGKVSMLLKKAGGTITGAEGNLVTVCFGSPLERVFSSEKIRSASCENNITAPALLAVDFVSGIAARPESVSWQFGLDIGNCVFAWTSLSGYFAQGAPVQRARMLSSMAGRYQARAVISAAICEALPDLPVKKLDVFESKDGSANEPFFRLTINE